MAVAQAPDRRRQTYATSRTSSAARCRSAGRSSPATSTSRSARSRCAATRSGLRPEDLREYCDENTIGVVATLGVTFTGIYEPVAALARALDELQRETGLDIPIHVDAASGGFIAPFIQQDLEWDFRVERVKSINASGHKYGLAPLGVGWVIWRDKADLPEELIFNVDYLGGDMPTFALNFSRPGGQIIAQYYNFLRLGRDGYTPHPAGLRRHRAVARRRDRQDRPARAGVRRQGRPARGLLQAEGRQDHGFTLYDLSERVRMRGWLIASYPLPADRGTDGGPAHPDPARRQPRPRAAAAGRSQPRPGAPAGEPGAALHGRRDLPPLSCSLDGGFDDRTQKGRGFNVQHGDDDGGRGRQPARAADDGEGAAHAVRLYRLRHLHLPDPRGPGLGRTGRRVRRARAAASTPG